MTRTSSSGTLVSKESMVVLVTNFSLLESYNDERKDDTSPILIQGVSDEYQFDGSKDMCA